MLGGRHTLQSASQHQTLSGRGARVYIRAAHTGWLGVVMARGVVMASGDV